MLFVVYGATLDMGYETRQIFIKNGFDVIKKYNYVEDDALVDKSKYTGENRDANYEKWYDDKVYVEKDQLEMLDFTYGLDGVHVGFNQQQIMDAVRGVKNAILTVGASSINLMVQLKKAYGDYVTIINLFEDMATVIAASTDNGSISDKERETRISANMRMQRLYIENREAFDEVVIYTGEGTPYDMTALNIQYETIIKHRAEIEKSLNDKKYVALPYSGSSPYLFISYAHADRAKIYPILAALQRHSFRVWYDDGIIGGSNWRKILAEKIQAAEAVLLFSSEHAVKSEHVEAEINGAFLCEKSIYTVKLDASRFDLAYEMYLSKDQMLDANAPDLEKRLEEALPQKVRNIES